MTSVKGNIILGGYDHRLLIGCISDKETTLGFLLAGIGQCSHGMKNYMITDEETPLDEIEEFFWQLYNRSNICAILISNQDMKRLSSVISKCQKQVPVLVEIPTKHSIKAYLNEREKLKRQMRRDSLV